MEDASFVVHINVDLSESVHAGTVVVGGTQEAGQGNDLFRRILRMRTFGDLLPRALGQLRKDELVAHVAQVEHEPLGQIGAQVDGDPRAPVGVVAGKHLARMLGAQLQDAVGVALE